MLSKKILSLLIAASTLAPLTTAIVEAVDSECVQAATEFIKLDTQVADSYSPCVYGMPPYYFTTTGDVNGDDKVNIYDYTLLKKYLETGGNVEIDKYNSDVNKDGEVTFLDLLALKDYI